MAGIQHRGCTSSRSMNVSQDGPQFNACDEQGYISSHSIYLHRERTGQKGGGGDGFHLIYQVLPNYTICAQANTNKKHLRAHVVDNHSHVPTIQISICRPHASIYTHTQPPTHSSTLKYHYVFVGYVVWNQEGSLFSPIPQSSRHRLSHGLILTALKSTPNQASIQRDIRIRAGLIFLLSAFSLITISTELFIICLC